MWSNKTIYYPTNVCITLYFSDTVCGLNADFLGILQEMIRSCVATFSRVHNPTVKHRQFSAFLQQLGLLAARGDAASCLPSSVGLPKLVLYGRSIPARFLNFNAVTDFNRLLVWDAFLDAKFKFVCLFISFEWSKAMWLEQPIRSENEPLACMFG